MDLKITDRSVFIVCVTDWLTEHFSHPWRTDQKVTRGGKLKTRLKLRHPLTLKAWQILLNSGECFTISSASFIRKRRRDVIHHPLAGVLNAFEMYYIYTVTRGGSGPTKKHCQNIWHASVTTRDAIGCGIYQDRLLPSFPPLNVSCFSPFLECSSRFLRAL